MSTKTPKIIQPYSSPREKGLHRPDKITNTQHLYPLGAGGSNNPENKITRYEGFHNSRHGVFGTLPPHMQIMRVLDLNHQVRSAAYRRELLKVLQEEDEKYIYRNGILLPRK